MATIIKLPDSTIKTIAAGEVITRPTNVVKELLENCLDAGSTNIRIVIEQSGVKSIEVIDNGHGIARVNAEVLCCRYTTSKLSCADDLNRIATFGFRGEALSSISEMADVEVKSFNMTVDKMGWQAKYKNGQLVEAPIDRYLQHPGTQIKVTNLFSAIQQRKFAMQSALVEEKKSIQDLIMRYGLHHRNDVTMSLRESNGGTDLVCVLAPMDTRPCIGMFFGYEMESNVIELTVEWGSHFSAEIYFSYRKTAVGFHGSNFILFVNNRLVECNDLKREIDTLIKEHLNSKQHVPFTYIDLKVPAKDVDVNTHPAKASVALHHHVEIVASIVDKLREKLRESLSTQTMAPGSQKLLSQLVKTSSSQQSKKDAAAPLTGAQRLCLLANLKQTPQTTPAQNLSAATPKRQYDLVHNDSTQQSLDQLLGANKTKPKERSKRKSHDVFIEPWPGIDALMSSSKYNQKKPERTSKKARILLSSDDETDISGPQPHDSPPLVAPRRPRRDMKLRSLIELKQQVDKEARILKDTSHSTIRNSTFIGIFDHDRALIQHETKLFAINLKAYLKEQCYQFFLFDFGNFPSIELLPPGNKIAFIIDTYLEDIYKHDASTFRDLKYDTSRSVIDELEKHAPMYEDYLTLKFTRDEILTLPCIMPDEVPNLAYLGKFLVDLVNRVDYSEERECIRMMGRVVADFYSEAPANLKDKDVHRRYHELIETKLYVAIKNYLMIPEWLFEKENIVQISDTKDLYKVFERC